MHKPELCQNSKHAEIELQNHQNAVAKYNQGIVKKLIKTIMISATK